MLFAVCHIGSQLAAYDKYDMKSHTVAVYHINSQFSFAVHHIKSQFSFAVYHIKSQISFAVYDIKSQTVAVYHIKNIASK